MKVITLSSLVVLFAIASMVAIAPNAFADHHSATVTNAPGSSVPGCEETADGCFIPNTVTIDIGGIVTWENNDTAAHTSTGGSATDGPSGVFDSSLIMAGSSFSHTFEDAGTFDYFCMVHPWMVGTVIVEDMAAAAAAEADAAEAAAAEADAAEAAAAEAAAAEADAAEAAAAAMTVRDPAVDLVDTLSHSTSNGSVSSIMTNSDDATLVVAMDTSDDGELSINLDSDYITAFDDGSYFVLVNGEEAAFSQDGNDLTIPFEAGTEKIEIVGSVVVPEFGTIAMIVLAVAIVSIIAITAKTRTTLIPKL
ncbi:MAG TPA: PEFG-CTERM sorting domain-containing protein [Candidatus Nitrosopelagicus sp.]|nr:PEFG-CTERM sorting domain-containing protein [Candidatus Nitrosopelagicus sp.]